MKKIPTILPKNPENLGEVIPGSLMPNIDHFKLKIDGTATMIKDGIPYCRFDLKKFRKKRGKLIEFSDEELKAKLPKGAIPCQEADEKSGHWPHWIPVLDTEPSHKHIIEGFNNLKEKIDGTYECIGPKLQTNPHEEDYHIWIPHFHDNLTIKDIDIEKLYKENNAYEFFKEYFKDFPFEGLVAYNKEDEPIGKIRRSDFGYKKDKYNKATELFDKKIK